MKDRLTIKNNQRHKFSNFGEPCTLNSYCEKPRCHTNTRFLLKNAGNDFWFDLCYHEAVICKIFSQFQKNKGKISHLFQLIENSYRLFCRKIQKLEMTVHFLTKIFAWTIFSKQQPVLNAWKISYWKIKSRKFPEKYRYQESCAFDFYKFWELLTSYCFSKTWFESENVARIFHKTNRVIYDSVSLTIRLQSSRFSKIHQFVPLIIFYCEPIFHVIRVSNSHVCQKTVPAIFEKKRLSLSLLWLSKLSLKVENGSCCQHRAPPG